LRSRPAEPGEPVPDADLLARYTTERDDAAFELLVWRHAVLVAGICRHVIRDAHLAEDAFQATFLILARNAGSIRGTNLSGWLFRVARRTALRAKRRSALRNRREIPLSIEPILEAVPHPLENRELLAILDEEIARLPERFRLPVVLCSLGGMTTEDAGRVLGCPRGTILSRLASARTRLTTRLKRRGIVVPAAGLASAVVLPPISPSLRSFPRPHGRPSCTTGGSHRPSRPLPAFLPKEF
jgi:RNA polymerase sigma factor (sigma-70 family)